MAPPAPMPSPVSTVKYPAFEVRSREVPEKPEKELPKKLERNQTPIIIDRLGSHSTGRDKRESLKGCGAARAVGFYRKLIESAGCSHTLLFTSAFTSAFFRNLHSKN